MLIEFLAAVALAGAEKPVVIYPPHWTQRPTANDIAAAYPDKAQHALTSGQADLQCRVDPQGVLVRCRVFAEAPLGWGFGAAALSLSPKFRMSPPAPTADDVEPMVYIPIRFRIVAGPGPPYKLPTFGPMVVTEPRWARAPTFDDVAAAFPAAATSSSGDVELLCGVDASGGLETCDTLLEQPRGQGYAAAALSVTGRFALDLEGRPTRTPGDLRVGLKIHLTHPKSEAFQKRQIGQPFWIVAPTQAEAGRFFPAAASAKGLTKGRGVASCVVAPDGGLTNCAPLTADPEGLRFSEAAVQIASQMRMNPWTDAGGPVDGARVVLPIRFDLKEDRGVAK